MTTAAPKPAPTTSDDFWGQWPLPKRLWRRSFSRLFNLSDTGWFGLTPLRTHIHVCGYPRSGTTMLQMMLEYALPQAKRFGKEIRGYRASLYHWRNHELMVTKNPGDLTRLHELRSLYQGLRANLRCIVTARDPRDVFTSFHKRRKGEYYLDVPEWRRYDEHMRVEEAPDLLLLRYEDMVADIDGTQEKLETFTGEPFARPLRDFHKEERKDFDTAPLNGVRPVDTKTAGRWRAPEHVEQLRQVLAECPELPQRLIDLGYETDDAWTKALN